MKDKQDRFQTRCQTLPRHYGERRQLNALHLAAILTGLFIVGCGRHSANSIPIGKHGITSVELPSDLSKVANPSALLEAKGKDRDFLMAEIVESAPLLAGIDDGAVVSGYTKIDINGKRYFAKLNPPLEILIVSADARIIITGKGVWSLASITELLSNIHFDATLRS